MVFGSLFGKKSEEREEEGEFIEIEREGEEKEKMTIMIEDLEDYRDVERIQNLVREGNIVFLKIKSLRERNLDELKRSVARLRKTIIAMNGDIVGVDENFLVLTPNTARIYRGEEQNTMEG